MAVIPNKFKPARGDLAERVKALEEHVVYLEERLEYFASMTNKKIEETKDENN